MKKGKVSHIPKKLNDELNQDVFYSVCSMFGQHGHVCEGRITRDHAFEYAGKNVQEKWAIVPLCSKGHGVDAFLGSAETPKDARLWIALNRADDATLLKYSKCINLSHEKDRLNKKYGVYEQKAPTVAESVRQTFQESKKHWYLITSEDEKMIEKIRAFYKNAVGITHFPREIIHMALESEYLSIKDKLYEEDKKLFKELNFDK